MIKTFGLAAVFALAAAPTLAAPLLERIPVLANNSGAISVVGGVVAYQSFRLDRDATLRRVAWVGDAFVPATASFRIQLFNSPLDFSTLDAPAFEQTSTPDRITPRPFEFLPGFVVTLEVLNDLDLDRDFALVAGRDYFLSVAAVDISSYAWKTFEASCCSISVFPDGRVSFNLASLALGLYDDRITSVPTPAPSALALFGLGLGVVAAQRRAAR